MFHHPVIIKLLCYDLPVNIKIFIKKPVSAYKPALKTVFEAAKLNF